MLRDIWNRFTVLGFNVPYSLCWKYPAQTYYIPTYIPTLTAQFQKLYQKLHNIGNFSYNNSGT